MKLSQISVWQGFPVFYFANGSLAISDIGRNICVDIFSRRPTTSRNLRKLELWYSLAISYVWTKMADVQLRRWFPRDSTIITSFKPSYHGWRVFSELTRQFEFPWSWTWSNWWPTWRPGTWSVGEWRERTGIWNWLSLRFTKVISIHNCGEEKKLAS